jgi:hypothetical protein
MALEDLTGIGKLINSKVAGRANEDILSKPGQQVGEVLEDTAKAFRLFTAPIQLLATAQDRFERWLDAIRNAVPIERQVEARPEIAGPALMNLRFLDEQSELKELYLNLLRHAIDSETRDLVHPGFVKVLERLAPWDAQLFQLLSTILPFRRKLKDPNQRLTIGEVLLESIAELSEWSPAKIQQSLEVLSSQEVARASRSRHIYRGDPHY